MKHFCRPAKSPDFAVSFYRSAKSPDFAVSIYRSAKSPDFAVSIVAVWRLRLSFTKVRSMLISIKHFSEKYRNIHFYYKFVRILKLIV